jgi:hypothetical protein
VFDRVCGAVLKLFHRRISCCRWSGGRFFKLVLIQSPDTANLVRRSLTLHRPLNPLPWLAMLVTTLSSNIITHEQEISKHYLYVTR